jgi:hypothetical protein
MLDNSKMLHYNVSMKREIKNKKMTGYRYGLAPESGLSWNHRENKEECGVSMAKVGHMAELRSFAVMNLRDNHVKKYYYVGQIAGNGGDGYEICFKNIEKITYQQYKKLLNDPEIIQTSNDIAEELANRDIELINNGWSIGKTIDQIKEWLKNNTKK